VEIIAKSIIDVMAETFDLDGNEVKISASIGIALFPQDSANIKELLVNADAAMYHAKAAGRNAFLFYTPEMNNQQNS